jgi:hypothetical protein
MNKLGLGTVLLLALAFFNPASATTGTLGLEGGAIAITLIVVTVIISIGIGLGSCIYKNDLCSCGKGYNQV